MGLKDRLGSAKRWMWSPMTVWMADQGCDRLVRAGEQATVVVDVRGEDDGTPERIEVLLQMIGWGNDTIVKWPLAELPPTLGVHRLDVTIPPGIPPACARYADYSFEAVLHRSKGTEAKAGSVVDVVARPEDLYWPEEPRAGQDGPDEARIAIELDAADDVVAIGTPLTGRVTIFATCELRGHDVELAVGPTLDTLVQVAGKSQPQPRAKFQPVEKVKLVPRLQLAAGERLELPFSVNIEPGVPPTLHNGGKTSIVWQVRVTYGDAVAWQLVGVLDPEAKAGRRDAPSPSLVSFLVGLESAK